MQLPRVLPNENRTGEPIIAVGNGIQNRFSNDLLIECGNVTDEGPILVVQNLIPEIDHIPQLIENAENTDSAVPLFDNPAQPEMVAFLG